MYATSMFYPVGERAECLLPGDFILTHDPNIWGAIIRFGQRISFRGPRAKYAKWNHAALIVDSDGTIVEALGTTVQRNHISKYDSRNYHVVYLDDVDPRDRQQAVDFANACVGIWYGWTEIFSLLLNALNITFISFEVPGQQICSGLVARALERMGAIFRRDSWRMRPADLAEFYEVEE